MKWKGMAIGGCLGSLFGGPLGALFGAALGHQLEEKLFSEPLDHKNSMIFCASAAAMLAKIAKIDGRVSREEIAQTEAAFARLGFRAATRQYAVNVFRKAKDDPHPIYEYAREFASAVGSVEVRELLYELLWDVAGADGVYTQAELEILRRIPQALDIRSAWFSYFASFRIARPSGNQKNELADAYTILGVNEKASLEEIRARYRELAKKNHPDALRAQGLPEEMVGKATEKMGRINAAWSRIKASRGS